MSEGVDQLRAEVRQFLAAQLAAGVFEPRVNSWMDAHDPEFSRLLGQQGWIGMTWPRRYGGAERTAFERHAVTEELLAAGAPVAAHWFADRQIGPQLLRFGTDEQRNRFLPQIATGRCFFAIGMSEPDAGSDLASIRTVAKRDGDGWRLRGTKVWTSHANRSGFMMTLCRTAPKGEDRHAGLSQLIVDLEADGVQVNPIEGIDGEPHFCEVVLDEVLVPAENLVGTEGNGWEQVTSELAYERSGPERFLSTILPLREAVEIAGTGSHRADREQVGRAFAQLMALRRLSLDVVGGLERGAADDVQAALVKDLGTRFEQELVEALRLPRTGQCDDGAHSEFLATAQLSAPTYTLRGGTTEILRGIVGRALIGR